MSSKRADTRDFFSYRARTFNESNLALRSISSSRCGVSQVESASCFPDRAERETHLLVDMEDKDESAEQEDRRSQHNRHPRDPIPRMKVQLLSPRTWVLGPLRLERDYEHLRVGNDALDVDVVLGLVAGRADEEVLDVVVRSAEAKVGVGSSEGEVGRLRELAVCEGAGPRSAAERRGERRRNVH